MTRDPAPDPHTPHGGQAPAAQPLTEILLTPPARPSRPPTPPPVEAPPSIELTIDGAAGHGPGGHDDPRRLPRAGHRHADPVLRREPDAGQRLPGVRRRGDRLARARAGLLAQGRGRDGGADRLRAGPPRRARSCSSSWARRWTCRWPARPCRTARSTTTWSATARIPTRYGPPAAPAAAGERDAHEPGHHHAAAGEARPPRPSPSRPRSTTSSTSATTRSASSATSASRRAARTPRTRSRSRSRGAGSTPGSRPSRPCRCPSRRASTAATASASARRAR